MCSSDLFGYWKSRYFFVSGDGWETLSDDFWGDVPRLLRRWETPLLGAFAPLSFYNGQYIYIYIYIYIAIIPDPCVLPFVVKKRLELESEFDERVQAAVQ